MLPKHHRTSFFLKSGLFDNISNFAELEDRISRLSTTVEVGDAFEIFAEAYFFTQKIEQAEEVYPFKSVPSSIKEDLSLGTNQQDMGVDGVYKTTSSQFSAYQAKFRTGRPSLTWREISTFMGLTDNVSHRVLFTNCNDMPSVINDRTGFHCIRGNDLDRLDKSDFETILKWLQSGEVEVERKTPLPHQDEAVKDILAALKDDGRATALMACGTGKTLVALWVSERMDCQSILVLLPSLTLVRQTLHGWLKETEWQHLSYLCVCSDPTVASRELDNIKVNQSDLDFAVTTECNTVEQFLSQDTKGIKIVFSTYQSSHIVAEGMGSDFLFDLGIFDEAHKTAGRKGKKFGFALNDDNLRIKKRLFLTATPRHYNIRKKNKEGDFDLVYSMEDSDVYGKVAHELSFAKAARQDIICNYKVIISVVTSEQVSKEILKKGEVLIKGDVVSAQLVAHQIAFKKAIEKYNINRIFTFHKSVAAAKSFTGKGSKGIHTQLPKFNTFHVNGTMPTVVREGIMNEFKNSDYSVISNARCLTEGVDLPAVDMVAFMSPKKSKVDIVQATGRAMRKDPQNPDKTYGYILVPLYLEMATEEKIEDAVEKTDFRNVWDVLQALQEQDEVLTDTIRQMQEDKGKDREREGDDFGEIVDILGVDISLKTLQKAITAVCVETLGFTWDFRFGELIKYKKKHGNCNVPGTFLENEQLSNWVSTQRTCYRTGTLSETRINRMESIGFEWYPLEERWDDMFEELKEHKNKHGDFKVSRDWKEDYRNLAVWVNTQKRSYNEGVLRDDRIKRLEKIGFQLGIIEYHWDEMVEALKEFVENHLHCNVPNNWIGTMELANWTDRQRINYEEKKLANYRIKLLENLCFEWERGFPMEDKEWEKLFHSLKEYKKNYGDFKVSVNCKLGRWVMAQHSKYKNNELSENCIRRLESIGFEFITLSKEERIEKEVEKETEKKKTVWERRFDSLCEYKSKHGNCNIPNNWEENKKLSKWVEKQRVDYRDNKLSEECVELLDAKGFEWNNFSVNKKRKPKKKERLQSRKKKQDEEKWEIVWNAMFYALKEYKKKYGDCNDSSSMLLSLRAWADKQRTNYKSNNLSDVHIKCLEEIGFEW